MAQQSSPSLAPTTTKNTQTLTPKQKSPSLAPTTTKTTQTWAPKLRRPSFDADAFKSRSRPNSHKRRVWRRNCPPLTLIPQTTSLKKKLPFFDAYANKTHTNYESKEETAHHRPPLRKEVKKQWQFQLFCWQCFLLNIHIHNHTTEVWVHFVFKIGINGPPIS